MRFFDITSDIENACLHDAIEFLELYILHGTFTSDVLKKARAVSAYAGNFVKKKYLIKIINISLRIATRPASRFSILSVSEAGRLLTVLRSMNMH